MLSLEPNISTIYLIRNAEMICSISGTHVGHADLPPTGQGEQAPGKVKTWIAGALSFFQWPFFAVGWRPLAWIKRLCLRRFQLGCGPRECARLRKLPGSSGHPVVE